MTRTLQTLALVFTLALGSAATGRAQEKPAATPNRPASPLTVTPLKVQVVISRYQGEKKVSSLPYTLSVNANGGATLRMGASVPVMMTMPTAPPQYKDIGTKIDCNASMQDDGRFRIEITVDDTSMYPDEKTADGSPGNPSFRSFRATDSMILKDGQTAQFTAATDKVSGETIRVDVTLTVMK